MVKVGLAVLFIACTASGQQRGWVLDTASPAPPTRADHAVAFDSKRNQVILFGGRAGNDLSDTWLLTPSGWMNPNTGTNPFERRWHAMAYDSQRDYTVMFGGSCRDDTWEYNGTDWIWRRPADVPSPTKCAPSMAYDSHRGRTVMFAGLPFTSDTWEWTGQNWVRGPSSGPPGRDRSGMAFDSARGRVVLWGGVTGVNIYLADTWEYDGVAWTAMTPSFSPPAMISRTLAYDSLRQRTVLFGWVATDVPRTWEWDGRNWSEPPLNSLPNIPNSNGSFAMAYDANRSQLVLVAGRTTGTMQTWLLDSGIPATYGAFGTGCQGSNGRTPRLQARTNELPWTGSTFNVEVSDLPGSGLTFMALGLSKTNWGGVPLPVGLDFLQMPGCFAYCDHIRTFPIVNAGGRSIWTMFVPDNLGLDFYNQVYALDANANPFGLITSNAGEGVIGQ